MHTAPVETSTPPAPSTAIGPDVIHVVGLELRRRDVSWLKNGDPMWSGPDGSILWQYGPDYQSEDTRGKWGCSLRVAGMEIGDVEKTLPELIATCERKLEQARARLREHDIDLLDDARQAMQTLLLESRLVLDERCTSAERATSATAIEKNAERFDRAARLLLGKGRPGDEQAWRESRRDPRIAPTAEPAFIPSAGGEL